jgi:hypothetical protein
MLTTWQGCKTPYASNMGQPMFDLGGVEKPVSCSVLGICFDSAAVIALGRACASVSGWRPVALVGAATGAASGLRRACASLGCLHGAGASAAATPALIIN